MIRVFSSRCWRLQESVITRVYVTNFLILKSYSSNFQGSKSLKCHHSGIVMPGLNSWILWVFVSLWPGLRDSTMKQLDHFQELSFFRFWFQDPKSQHFLAVPSGGSGSKHFGVSTWPPLLFWELFSIYPHWKIRNVPCDHTTHLCQMITIIAANS